MKKISIKLKSANPLFEKLLLEWKNEAKEKDSKSQHTYTLALASLRKYPLPLRNAEECKMLKGFGSKLCTKLGEALKKHRENNENISEEKLSTNRHFETVSSDEDIEENIMEEKRIEQNKVEDKPTTDIILAPFQFDVILCVDNCETVGPTKNRANDPILSELVKLKVKFDVRKLDVGDYCWIFKNAAGIELVAPFIIERKRMDDLASSIKDGRFHEQKFRLKQCNVPNVIYMIESIGKNDGHLGLPLTSLYQATVNTMIQDKFIVKFVEGPRGIAEYLACMSNLIKKRYEFKSMISSSEFSMDHNDDSMISLLPFNDFNKMAVKTKAMTLKELFVKHLLHINGMPFDKAWAFVEMFQTPSAFVKFAKSSDKVLDTISNIKCGKSGRKFGPILSKIVYEYLTNRCIQ